MDKKNRSLSISVIICLGWLLPSLALGQPDSDKGLSKSLNSYLNMKYYQMLVSIKYWDKGSEYWGKGLLLETEKTSGGKSYEMRILTAHHIVKNSQKVELSFYNDKGKFLQGKWKKLEAFSDKRMFPSSFFEYDQHDSTDMAIMIIKIRLDDQNNTDSEGRKALERLSSLLQNLSKHQNEHNNVLSTRKENELAGLAMQHVYIPRFDNKQELDGWERHPFTVRADTAQDSTIGFGIYIGDNCRPGNSGMPIITLLGIIGIQSAIDQGSCEVVRIPNERDFNLSPLSENIDDKLSLRELKSRYGYALSFLFPARHEHIKELLIQSRNSGTIANQVSSIAETALKNLIKQCGDEIDKQIDSLNRCRTELSDFLDATKKSSANQALKIKTLHDCLDTASIQYRRLRHYSDSLLKDINSLKLVYDSLARKNQELISTVKPIILTSDYFELGEIVLADTAKLNHFVESAFNLIPAGNAIDSILLIGVADAKPPLNPVGKNICSAIDTAFLARQADTIGLMIGLVVDTFLSVRGVKEAILTCNTKFEPENFEIAYMRSLYVGAALLRYFESVDVSVSTIKTYVATTTDLNSLKGKSNRGRKVLLVIYSKAPRVDLLPHEERNGLEIPECLER